MHCAADGLARRPVAPVFDGKAITLQSLRTCQQVFSGAFTAHIEAVYGDDDAAKNRLCVPVPHPDNDADFLRTTLGNFLNQLQWMQDEKLMDWLRRSRLDGFISPERDDEGPLPETDPGPVMEAIPKLQRMLAELEEPAEQDRIVKTTADLSDLPVIENPGRIAILKSKWYPELVDSLSDACEGALQGAWL